MLKHVLILTVAVSIAFAKPGVSQSLKSNSIFEDVKMVVNDNGKFRQKPVRLTFEEDRLLIEGKLVPSRSLVYREILSAEYSYSKTPRWKTGLGLSAAAFLVPPLWFISIPIGFTKHRRHWLTIRTADDFAVLKLSKNNRKFIIPTLETRSGVNVKALGEDK